MEFDLETISLLKEKAQNIVKTLPIAHYFKISTLDVVFDETSPTSFIDLSTLKINVAFNNLLLALKSLDAKDVNDLTIEKIIRGCLYHELSHALLTPRELMPFFTRSECFKEHLTPDLINILEDERIERTFENYYMNVDFQENVNLLNHGAETKIENFTQFVFVIIRMHFFPKEMTEGETKTLISLLKGMISMKSADAYSLLVQFESIIDFLEYIWEKITTKVEGEPESSDTETTKSSGTSTKTDDELDDEDLIDWDEDFTDDELTDDEPTDDEPTDEKSDDVKDKKPTEFSLGEPVSIDEDTSKKIIDSKILDIKKSLDIRGKRELSIKDFVGSSSIKNKLISIIIRNKGIGIEEKNSSFGYTGKLKTKKLISDISRNEETYKWFEKSFESDEKSKKDNKKVLNIWLDQSGSFSRNDDSINEILKSLTEIEDKNFNFSFNLIKLTCNCRLVENKDKRYSRSFSGNALPYGKISKTYKKVNPIGNEFNIVLFDGYACSNDFHVGDEEKVKDEKYGYGALKVFNNKKSFFITEESNEFAIKTNCPSCRGVIVENRRYAKVLSENVVKALDLLF